MTRGRRFRIRFNGHPSSGIVAWLQKLIPVLRQAPEEVEIDVEIRTREAEPGDSEP